MPEPEPATPQGPRLLEYGRPDASALRRRGPLLALACLPAAVLPFIPFYWSVSPWDAIAWLGNWVLHPGQEEFDRLALVGGPFFLAIFLLGHELRCLAFGPPSPSECWLALLLSVISAGGTIFMIGVAATEAISNQDPFALFAPGAAGAVLATGGFLIWLHWLRRRDRAELIRGALGLAWLGNAVLCLVIFSDSAREIGWYLTLACVPLVAWECWYPEKRDTSR